MIATANYVAYTYGWADIAWDMTHDAPILAPVTNAAQAVLPHVSVGWGLGIWGALSLLALGALAYVVLVTRRTRFAHRMRSINVIPTNKNSSRRPGDAPIKIEGDIERSCITDNYAYGYDSLLDVGGDVIESNIKRNVVERGDSPPSRLRRGIRRAWRSRARGERRGR